MHQYMLGGPPSWKQLGRKDSGGPGDTEWNMSQPCTHAVKKVNGILGRIRQSFTNKSRKVIPTLSSAVVRPHLVQFWAPHCKRCRQVLERAQWRATKILKGLGHLSYEERLKELGFPAWRREGSGRTSSRYINTWREGAKRTELGFISSAQWQN